MTLHDQNEFHYGYNTYNIYMSSFYLAHNTEKCVSYPVVSVITAHTVSW